MAVLKNFTSVGMTDFKERMRRTNGVASHFDLEAILNTKNMNMNSLELRNMLYEKKTGKKAVETAAEEMDYEE